MGAPETTSRRERELLHLLASTRLYAQRAVLQTQRGIAVLRADGHRANAEAHLADAARAMAQVDVIARTGICACLVGTCEFAVPRRPLRVDLGVRVRPVRGGLGVVESEG
jgi:hypothetical protein